ncbi:MAG: hypothetical protein AAGC95_07575 [Pseudomonadota bacterium]
MRFNARRAPFFIVKRFEAAQAAYCSAPVYARWASCVTCALLAHAAVAGVFMKPAAPRPDGMDWSAIDIVPWPTAPAPSPREQQPARPADDPPPNADAPSETRPKAPPEQARPQEDVVYLKPSPDISPSLADAVRATLCPHVEETEDLVEYLGDCQTDDAAQWARTPGALPGAKGTSKTLQSKDAFPAPRDATTAYRKKYVSTATPEFRIAGPGVTSSGHTADALLGPSPLEQPAPEPTWSLREAPHLNSKKAWDLLE